MRPPRFLIGAALLFWGWQTDYLILSTVMAVVLESTHFLKPRWEFADEDFSRIWTFCSLLLLGSTVYAFTANDSASNLLSFLQDPNLFTQRRAGSSSAQSVASLMRWLPIIFFTFVAAGAFSSREGVPLRTVSLILQRRWKEARALGQPSPPSPTVSVGYPYFGLCLFSASIHSNDDGSFFWGLCVLIGWALWPLRSRRYRFAAWGGSLLLAFTFGYVGQRALGEFQQYLGTLNPQWFTKYSRRGFDPKEARTTIGQVGETKLSPQIVIRLEARNNSKPPSLLRESSYRAFKGRSWNQGSTREDFENIAHAQTNDTHWVLLEDEKAAHGQANIACYLPGGNALLPLPRGTARVEQLPAYILQKNNMGAVRAVGPGLVIFDAFFGPGATLDSAPDDEDINNIPHKEVPALARVVSELGLEGKPLPEVMASLNQFFQSKFDYSMWQGKLITSSTNDTPLANFLLSTRSGHCEYFATATVLLLRQLGFPARYAVGYAVHERAGENKFVVRQRDAHAWSLVWTGARWVDFDTTPATWFSAEGQRASRFQAFSDFWSRVRFELAKIRWGQSHLRQYVLWALVPVLGLLLFQVAFRARRSRRPDGLSSPLAAALWPGVDSEFYQLEKRLAPLGLIREPAESMGAFVGRALIHPALLDSHRCLQEALVLHYRYRFDPHGLSSADRESLREIAHSSIQNLKGPHAGVLNRLCSKLRPLN